ncbi:Glutamyl-tRNA reductase, partial [Clarias magur]
MDWDIMNSENEYNGNRIATWKVEAIGDIKTTGQAIGKSHGLGHNELRKRIQWEQDRNLE